MTSTPTTSIVNVADLKPEGSDKTYRQLNREKTWNVPLNSLVKVLRYNSNTEEYEDNPHGLVLRVTKQGRDCDGTPMYWLSHLTAEEYEKEQALLKRGYFVIDGMSWKGELFGTHLDGGYTEESLKLIARPEEIEEDD